MEMKFETETGERITIEVPKDVKGNKVKKAETVLKKHFPTLKVKSKKVIK